MSSKRNAKLLKAVLSAAPFACGFMAMPAGAQNMTYAFTPAPGTFAWSSGTGWTPSAPASGINTALLFTDNATSFASGLNTTSVNDLAGFQLNELDLTGTGPAAAPTAVINITGNDLTFVNNGTSDPIINLLAANGSQGLTYNVSNNLTLNNNLTVQGGASATYNFTGNIVGTAGLTKMNGSTLVLKGTNTYAGSTTISGGTLRATQASALDGFNSVGSVTVNSAATLSVVGGGNGWSSAQIDTLLASAIFTTGSNFAIHVDPSNSFSYGSNISQPTGFVKSGNGILTLSGNNTFTGGATLSGGQLNVNSATALGGGPFTVAAAGSIDNTTSGAITLTNNNAITLNNNLTFVGTKDLNFGPTSVVTFNAPRTIIVRGGTLSVGSLSNAGSASGSLTKQGGGTLAVTGNTAAGAYIDTTVSGGVLAMGSVSLLGSGDLTLSGGDLNISSAAGAGRAISSGPLIDGSGRDTITLAPAAGGSVTLTASSLGNRGNYATELYRGTNLGTAAPGANVSNIFFTSAPTVNQGGGGTFSGANSFAAVDGVGALNGPGAAVLRGALIDTTATGNGTSFATYDSTVGIRALKPSEQISTVTTNDNVRLNLAAGTTSFVGAVLNTLQLDNTSGSAAVATFSGAAGSFAPANGILFTGSSPITLSTQNVLTFGTGISTPNDVVILSTNSAGATVGNMMVATVAFNRGYTLGGPGLLTVGGLGGVATNGAVTITGPGTVTFNGATSTSSGGIVVAGGTLKLGSSFSISNTNSQRDFAVGAGATFDLNGFTMTAGNAYEALDNFNGAGGIVTNSSANAATLTLSHFQDIGTNRTFSGNITGNLNFVLNTIAGVTGTQTLANTSSYTGFTTVSSGTLVLGINNALPGTTTLSVNGGGTTSAVLEMGGFSQLVDTLSGTIAAGATGIGTIQNGSVNTTSTLTIGGSGVGTFAGAIVDNQGVGGTVAVVRSGTGETNLDGTGSYTGGTTVSGGLFRVNGLLSSAANSVTVNGGTLGGKGTITGPVAVTSSGHIAPGAGVGTLTLKSTLSLASGSHLDYELVAPGNNDVIDVSNASNAFTLNGGVFNLLTPGGVTPFSDPGTYQLIKFAGAIQGTGLDSSWTTVSPTNAHVLDPQLFKSYAFGSSGGFLTLTINSTTTTGTWTGSASNSWGSGATNANWNNSVTPGAPGDTAIFGSGAARFLVNLDGSRTVGGITFNSATPYTIAQGSGGGTLFMDESTATAAITDSNGTHSITAPISLSSNTAVNVVNAGDMLSISGNISGVGSLTKSGSGALTLSGSNSFTGAVINAGTLLISADNNLGQAPTIINAGALQTSTSIATSRAFQVGSASSTIDVEGSASLELDGSVTNATTPGTLNKNGPGTLVINGNVSATGGVAVAAGTLQLGNGTTGGSLGTAPVNIGAAGVLTVNRTGSTVIGGPVSGTGSLLLPANTNVTLGGNNGGYAGNISATGATLVLGNASGIGSANLVLNSSTLTASTAASIFNGGSAVGSFSSITFNGSNVIDTAGNAITLSAQLNGSGTVTRNGTGTLVLGVGSNTNFSNTFFGGTFLNSTGNLDFSSRLAGSRNAAWIFNGGTVTISQGNGGSVEYGLLQGNNPSVAITLTAATTRVSIGNLGGTSSFAGTITSTGGSISMAKVGTGTLILSGQNTFGGTDGLTITGQFSGYPVIVQTGTLVAGSSTTGTTSGPFGGAPTYDPSVGSLTGGAAILLGGLGSLTSASVVTGGAFTVTNDITVSGGSSTMTATPYTLAVGGVSDSSSTFSGKITMQNNLTVSQVATTGSNALNLTGGMYGFFAGIGVNNGTIAGNDNTGFQTVTFAGAGSVNVTGVIADVDPNPTNYIAKPFAGFGGVVSVTSTGGTTKLTAANNYSGATTVAGGTLILGTNAQAPVLSGSGGGIVNSGRLVLDYNGGTDPATTVKNILTSGFPGQFQSGQIRTTNATEATQLHGIGWVDNPATKQVTIRYTWLGDADLNGVVNLLDLNAVATDFGKTGQVWGGGDFDYNGTVNIADFNKLAANFGQVMAAAPLPSQALLGTLVPEPASLGLIGLGMVLGVRRRRR